MELRLLGPVEVWNGGRQVAVGGAKPRALLAALLLEAGRVVTRERLVEAIWEDDPPTTARGVVQSYVASLRRAFAGAALPDIIVSHRLGYLVQIAPGVLDKEVFERLVTEGRQAARNGGHREAGQTFRTALGLWRGEALGGIGTSYLHAEAVRLGELKMAVTEERITADLAAGDDDQLIDELIELVALHPGRERLRRDLMVALYRVGRQADALAVYQQGRQVLIEELGVEPGLELRQAQEAILRSDPALKNPAKPVARMPRQLPRPVPDFTGRQQELAALRERLTRPAATPICVISGQGGIGKSALALRTAHEIAQFYPDGQLHVELRGSTPAPASPEETLGRLLRELEPAGTQLPLTLEERISRYRTLLADQRKLVVLDDAASEAQIRPLLPGGSSSGVIVTSRNRLSGLAGAALLDLGMLPPQAAIDLLTQIAGRERIAADPGAAQSIADQCGHLPLALRIAGARLASRRQWSARRLADRLADEQHRLDELAAGDQQVRASIALSYAMLPPTAKTVLRRLGLLGLPSFPVWVAATAVETGLRQSEQLLEQLVEASLIEEVDAGTTGQSRYRLHDLIRLFAAERARAEESAHELTAMVARVLSSWLWLVKRLSEAVPATAIFKPACRGLALPVADEVARSALADPHAWFRREEESLIVGVELAAALDLDWLAVEIACTVSAVYEGSQYLFDDPFAAWQRMHQAALVVARRTDNVLAEAALLAGLGHLYYARDAFVESRQYLTQALSLFRAAKDTGGQAATLAALGASCREQGYLAEALHFLTLAEDLCGDLADVAASAHVKRLAGTVHLERGHYSAAWADLTAALTLYQEADDDRGVGLTLRSMSLYRRARKEYAKAEELSEQALEIFRRNGDQLLMAYCERALAKARIRLGKHDVARKPLEEVLVVMRALQDRWGEACTLRTPGELDLAEGRLYQAKSHLQEALQRWETLRVGPFSARTQRDLALVYQALGDDTTADALLATARQTFRLHGCREYDELSL
ncbi:BTAD domain-containing putative transcriptional regulator [Planobispora siamensis]|uniref:SARP family transcriptional regulator n=1 Tax=Planobispora siamensis TaxID=936338 RepID=A0A8J3SQX1_9ACTN|nr:AfsR/SARP family transcriptional regulator [Planobispora siamensis]GIH97709.1 SARP family transcriptional regulator [Planobispora siamensis]